MKLVILDRDGVINHDSEAYIKHVGEWKPIDGSVEAIAKLAHAGLRVCVATNQSGIGRGLFDFDALAGIHSRMQEVLAEHGGRVDAVAFCPHTPDDGCACRKPQPGMLTDLLRRWQVEPADACYVGDSWKDVQAARAAGVKPVLVRTGNGAQAEREHESELAGVDRHDDLAAFAQALSSA